jgi:hypothetical protein
MKILIISFILTFIVGGFVTVNVLAAHTNPKSMQRKQSTELS